MYHESPMEKYNKNNPFIIIAKKTYDDIMDKIQNFAKECVGWTSGLIIMCILILVCYGIRIYEYREYIINISSIATISIINILLILKQRSIIKYFIHSSPIMQEFTRISKLEVNDIIALNNEDVLNCIHGLYELRGELKTSTKCYQNYCILCLIIELLIMLISAII